MTKHELMYKVEQILETTHAGILATWINRVSPGCAG